MISSTLSAVSAPVPTAAAERNLPSSSLAAFGKSSDFLMSFKVFFSYEGQGLAFPK